MASYTQRITLDVNGMCLPFYKYMKQGDGDSTWIVVTITANGTQLLPSNTDTATIRVTKPDGTIVNNPATINEDGTITARITKAMTAAEGMAKADICLIGENNELLSTATFFLDIDSAPGVEGLESTNEFLYLLELLPRIEESVEQAEQAKDEAIAAVHIIGFRDHDGYIQYTNDGNTWNNLCLITDVVVPITNAQIDNLWP